MAETKNREVLTAMITPRNELGRVDFDNVQIMARYLIKKGSDGLVLAGTTGESPTITAKEQITLFKIVRDAVGKDVYLMGGTGSNSTEEAVELSIQAEESGALDALLVVSPYYNKPSQFGIADYYRRIAEVTELPKFLYNIQGRTGRKVELDTVRRLLDEHAVQGIKDATGNTEMADILKYEFGDDIDIYSGDDGLNLAFFKVGAIGAISVASHWAGEAMKRMYEAAGAGHDDEAEAISNALEPSAKYYESTHEDQYGVERDTPNPGPAKVMMRRILGDDVVGPDVSPMLLDPEEETYLIVRSGQILDDLQTRMAEIELEFAA